MTNACFYISIYIYIYKQKLTSGLKLVIKRLNIHLLLSTIFGNPGVPCVGTKNVTMI